MRIGSDQDRVIAAASSLVVMVAAATNWHRGTQEFKGPSMMLRGTDRLGGVTLLLGVVALVLAFNDTRTRRIATSVIGSSVMVVTLVDAFRGGLPQGKGVLTWTLGSGIPLSLVGAFGLVVASAAPGRIERGRLSGAAGAALAVAVMVGLVLLTGRNPDDPVTQQHDADRAAVAALLMTFVVAGALLAGRSSQRWPPVAVARVLVIWLGTRELVVTRAQHLQELISGGEAVARSVFAFVAVSVVVVVPILRQRARQGRNS